MPLAACWSSRSCWRAFSFRTAIIETNKVRGSASFAQFIRRAKQPELPVILLEDFAALIGLVFALFGVALTLITGNYYFDVAGTAMIGLLLVVVAVVLGHRDQEPAARRVRHPRAPAPDRGRARRDRRRRADHPHEDPAPRPGGAAGRRQDRRPRAATAEEVAEAIDARRGGRPRGRADRPAIYLEPDIYRADYVPAERPEPPAPTAH